MFIPFFFYLLYECLVQGLLYMPNLRYESHHKICNTTSPKLWLWKECLFGNDKFKVFNTLQSVNLNGYLSEFNLWVLPLVTWIDGFLDWIFRERIFKILQSHNWNRMNVKWTNIVFVLRYGDETLHLWKPLLNTNDQRGSSQCLTQRNTIFVHFTFMIL